MKRYYMWVAWFSIALCVGLVACEEPYHAKEEQYYFISANINIPYWQEAQAGLTDAAKSMGVKAEMDGPTTLSPKDELDSFQKAVALHPAGILVSVANADLFKDAINAAVQAGIPVTLLQRWLGHARLESTAIYANVCGPEEREIARKFWSMA